MRLTTAGTSRNFAGAIVGRLSAGEVPLHVRSEHIRFFPQGDRQDGDVTGYQAVLSHDEFITALPSVVNLRDSDHLKSGDVVVLQDDGFVRSLYRPYEKHHSLFVTERCSSNCLMCSQPPKDRDDVHGLMSRNRELIRLMNPAPEYLTITGGEPTLLGRDLFVLLDQLKEHLPNTELHMLTNGRTFAWPEFARRFSAVGHPNISLGVPLYSDSAGDHDYIVQAVGAFDQTVAGLQQSARHNIRVEIRIVLHQLSIRRLDKLVQYIYRNLSFVEHVALMGLEYTGYTPRNIQELWIDPFDYQAELAWAVSYLHARGIPVSIYNHQLCVLERSLWRFAKKSISDWKNLYIPQCQDCAVREDCGGLFQWAAKKHSEYIRTIPQTSASRS